MNEDARHRFVWGWLRLILGFAQMSLVAASLGALITAGLHPVTFVLVFAATLATITSRLLYKGLTKADSTVMKH
jgi:hypothetical protein